MMHNVITNAVNGDPYRIDTLMIFMANMAWNSTMNTSAVREMLNARVEPAEAKEPGEYKIPFLIVCDAFQSEMVAYADLVLPDTTYLERHDVHEHAGPADLGVRRPERRGARPGRSTDRQLQALPGRPDRTGHAPEAADLHHRRRRAQVPATTTTSWSTSSTSRASAS